MDDIWIPNFNPKKRNVIPYPNPSQNLNPNPKPGVIVTEYRNAKATPCPVIELSQTDGFKITRQFMLQGKGRISNQGSFHLEK